MASQHMEDGSFLLNPKKRSSVPTLCFRIISYLHTEVINEADTLKPNTINITLPDITLNRRRLNSETDSV